MGAACAGVPWDAGRGDRAPGAGGAALLRVVLVGGAGQCGRGPASCVAGGTCAMPGVAGACARRKTLGIEGAGCGCGPRACDAAGCGADRLGVLRCDRVGGGVVRGRAARGWWGALCHL